MKRNSDFSLSNAPLYNSRIIKTYIYYVRKKYPHINISEILADAGMTMLFTLNIRSACRPAEMFAAT